MKSAIGFILLWVSFQLQAAIYICKDHAGKVSYQDTPCVTRTIGRLNNVPDAPIEDQLRVQASIQSADAKYQARMALREFERLQALGQARLQLALAVEQKKLALLELQAQQPPAHFVLMNRESRFNRAGDLNHVPSFNHQQSRADRRQSSSWQRNSPHHTRNHTQGRASWQFRSKVHIQSDHPS